MLQMTRTNMRLLLAAAFLLGLCLREAGAQTQISMKYHPGWLNPSSTATLIEVAAGWSPGWHSTGTGTCTRGERIFNPDLVPSHLWIDGDGYLESTFPVQVTQTNQWLFIQFATSDFNDGAAEIMVREHSSSDWLRIGGYDTFGRLHNWVSIEGLPAGHYYVKITARFAGRSAVPPNWCLPQAAGLHLARIGSTPPVPPEHIRVTSGGWVSLDGGKANFGMEIQFTAGDDRPRGTFTYVDHTSGVAILGTEIFGIDPQTSRAAVSLVVRGNDGNPRTARVNVLDGSSTREQDRFRLRLSDHWSACTVGWVYSVEQALGGGQIKIH